MPGLSILFQKVQSTRFKVSRTRFLVSECYRIPSPVRLQKNGVSSEAIYACLMTCPSAREITNSYQYQSRTGRAANFVDSFDFLSIVELCEKLGDAVIVGFTGGVAALEGRDLTALEGRTYKWDNITGGIGKRDQENWIPGSVFSDIISKKDAHPHESPKLNPEPKRASSYWEGTLNFGGMFDLRSA